MTNGRPSVMAVTTTGGAPGTQLVAGEVAEYTYDATNDLGAGQGVTGPTVSLVNLRTGAAVTGGAQLDTPAVTSNSIAMRVTGVERGVVYELRIQFDHSSPRVSGERTIRLHRIAGM